MRRVALVLALFFLAPATAARAPGDLDAGFGSGGIFVGDAFYGGSANAVAVDGDGRVVVGSCAEESWVVMRFTSDGRPDPSFGEGGRATVPGVGTSRPFEQDACVGDLVIRPDGAIVATAGAPDAATRARPALFQLHPDGSLDRGFGSAGVVLIDDVPQPGGIVGVRRRADGRLVIVVRSGSGIGILRYTSDGARDTSFGNGGAVFNELAHTPSGMTLQPDDKIVVS